MSDLTKHTDIQSFLKNECVPEALRALKGLLQAEDPKAADIKLAIGLAKEFGVQWETDEVKPNAGLRLLEGFSREKPDAIGDALEG